MNISEVISNLERVEAVLEKAINDPIHYNTIYSCHLEHISWEISRHIKELRCVESLI